MPVDHLELLRLQQRTECIRNLCVMAHVDHGKTSISDNLIATNGIISSRLCGTIMYLDSRSDEQERGITLKSSAISLYYRMLDSASVTSEVPQYKEYLLNLIDTPGHCDFFNSEVDTASRLCDGTLIVVDAVEGICSQTHKVLHQAWMLRLKPVLVINKLDKLVADLGMSAEDAYEHLCRVIQEANAIMATFAATAETLQDKKTHSNSPQAGSRCSEAHASAGVAEASDIFIPQSGNVVFCSATQRWGFRIPYFARLYSRKLGLGSDDELLKSLWGEEFYFDTKLRKSVPTRGKARPKARHMAVKLIFENLWTVFEACGISSARVSSAADGSVDFEKVKSIAEKLKISINEKELQRTRTGDKVVSLLLSSWLPLSTALLAASAEQIPSPIESQSLRLPQILDDLSPAYMSALLSCDRSADIAAGYVCRPISVIFAGKCVEPKIRGSNDGKENIDTLEPDTEAKRSVGEPHEIVVALARLYSGVLCKNDFVFISNGYKIKNKRVKITELYLIMGRYATPVDEIYAGNIFGVRFSDDIEDTEILLNSSFSTKPDVTYFGVHGMKISVPLLRVAVEPTLVQDYDKVIQGLKELKVADPSVCVDELDSGEQVLSVSGDIHLEKCLLDLKKKYAKCGIQVSDPIVPFRETIVSTTSSSAANLNFCSFKAGLTEVNIPGSEVMLVVECAYIPEFFSSYLVQECNEAKGYNFDANQQHDFFLGFQNSAVFGQKNQCSSFLETLNENELVALGPRSAPASMLFVSKLLDRNMPGRSALIAALVTGFRMAAEAGPVCAEPVHGVAFFARFENIDRLDGQAHMNREFCGNAIARMREACRSSMLRAGSRLLIPSWSCTVVCRAEALGAVHTVLLRRRARVVSEDMREGTPYFVIDSEVPALEALGIERELKTRSSGNISSISLSQSSESRWLLVDGDPTSNSLERKAYGDFISGAGTGGAGRRDDDFQIRSGTGGDIDTPSNAVTNTAYRYMVMVRKRKGMFVSEKIVEHGEKQRTLMLK